MYQQRMCVCKEHDYNEKYIKIESPCNYATSSESNYSFMYGDGVIDEEIHKCLFKDEEMYKVITHVI